MKTLNFCHFVDSQESEVLCDVVGSGTASGRSEARTNSGPVWFGASQIQYEAGGSRVKTFLQNLLVERPQSDRQWHDPPPYLLD